VDTLYLNTSNSLIENVKRFNDFIQEANKAEEGLKDISRIAKRAAQRQDTRAYTPRTPQGAQTFLSGYSQEEPSATTESINVTTEPGETICMPITFVAAHSSSCTQEHQDMMACVITTMDNIAADAMEMEWPPLTAPVS
jgi:hypothetical protein